MIMAQTVTPSLLQSGVLRFLISTLLAILITFSLFALMKWFITPIDDALVKIERELPRVELFEPPQETPPEIRNLVPPPPALTPPPNTLLQSDPSDSITGVDLGKWQPDMGITLDGPQPMANLTNNMATPLVRVEPRFPIDAARKGISGWVRLRFSIDESGSVYDIKVIEAEPRNIFDREAVSALRRWKYQPQLQDGKPLKQTDLQVQLDFQLAEQ
ncbi:protein TonB [Alishewanella tabrizica]|uniref:Protein TonB n=2 Tax=Alishewanella tabrizica TaxID=671278 RepID=A0ABQ2WLR5_9ALTE|nr:protein TonB [Alishewanella tabrizica]